ncbi:MAG: DNA cytosine methyltransferase [Kiritimatiellae bacterium]|nr:DNA cytosine methyltransferase [Kiritimatiellia bacterium]
MKALELFAGCGGLAKGLSLAGFEELAMIEFNQDACKSLRANFDPSIVHECDIREFDYSPFIGKVDLVAGGPPCQPFSLGGKAKGQNDSRDMFPEAARAIAAVHPRAFLFENVKGLLRASFRSYFEYIILRLTFPSEVARKGESWLAHCKRLMAIDYAKYPGVKYRVQYRLLNAADYGVPQVRERVIIVGLRHDVDKDWEYPDPICSRDEWRPCGEVLRGLPQPTDPPPKKYPDHVFRPGARPYHGHSGSDVTRPAKTIKAGAHGVPGGENTFRFNDGSLRYMTVHEAKLIQTFPSDYRILGTWGEAMRQIGNAVPVRLAEILGRQLAEILNRIHMRQAV